MMWEHYMRTKTSAYLKLFQISIYLGFEGFEDYARIPGPR